MPLGPVSLIDCVVFVLLLAPQLLLQAGIGPTLVTALSALPFVAVTLPSELAAYYLWPRRTGANDGGGRRPLFQLVVLCCTRWAFRCVPSSVGRVFFAKQVVMPFWRFRFLRHGHRSWPARVQDVVTDKFRGVWIQKDPDAVPDVVVYYIHGRYSRTNLVSATNAEETGS